MLLHDIIQIVVVNLSSELGEGELQVCSCDTATVVHVEGVEDGFESLLGEEVLDIDGSRYELTIVDLIIFGKVQLFDNFFDLLVSHLKIRVGNSLLKLLGLDETTLVGIDFLEDILELFNLARFQVLNQNVDGLLLEKRPSLELLQICDY